MFLLDVVSSEQKSDAVQLDKYSANLLLGNRERRGSCPAISSNLGESLTQKVRIAVLLIQMHCIHIQTPNLKSISANVATTPCSTTTKMDSPIYCNPFWASLIREWHRSNHIEFQIEIQRTYRPA